MTTHITHDDGWSIVAEAHSHIVDFKVFEIVGGDGEERYWARHDGMSNMTEKFEEADLYLHGSVKWDGCSDLHFDAQDDCMLHFCGRADVKKVGQMLSKLYDITAELLDTVDFD